MSEASDEHSEGLDDACVVAEASELGIDEVVASIEKSGLGYLSTPLAPWSSKTNIGRLTVWPKDKPPSRQSCAVRCYMHAGCSVTRSRQYFTDAQFFAWLVSFKPPAEDISKLEKHKLTTEHMKLAQTMLQTVKTRY